MRRLVACVAALLACVLAGASARASEPAASPAGSTSPEAAPASTRLLTLEPYVGSGFVFFSSDRRLIAGLGGGGGLRLGIGDHLAVHAEARGFSLVGNAATFAGGATYRIRYEAWEPFAGLQYAGFVGDQVKVVTSTQPDLPPPYAWAVQARLALIRFVKDSWTGSALGFDIGFGDDAGTRAFALSIGFLEIGYKF